MKLSDYVIDFLVKQGVTHIFGISGGAAVHLFDSVAKHPKISYVCPQHEQAAAIAADGYARTSNKLGVAITTSGPGATNLLTGVCCSYFDSVPTLMITGQVATHRLNTNKSLRQFGFQETNIVEIFRSITKYAFLITDPQTIRYHLEKAVYTAFEGRPGPVLIDLPDDLQRVDIDPDKLDAFIPPSIFVPENLEEIRILLKLMSESKRPLLVLGGGLSTPRLDEALNLFLNKVGFPIVTSWAGLDLVSSDNPKLIGPFGVYGPRAGNFAVQNSDLLICLGTRLSQNLTGGNLPSFAKSARIVLIDIDKAELNKFDNKGLKIDLKIHSSLKDFFSTFFSMSEHMNFNASEKWIEKIKHWKKVFPMPEQEINTDKSVEAYRLVDELSKHTQEKESIFVDTGGNLTWTMNGFHPKLKQRVISAWNCTPMGYALPASIGAAFWNQSQIITCIIGDGGLMMCLGELATVAKHQLPIKIILINNHCHGIQKQTLETWLEGNYVGVCSESGLSFPDFIKIGKAFDLEVISIQNNSEIESKLNKVYSSLRPVFCNVEISPEQRLYPVLKYGSSLENQLPLKNSSLLSSEMVLKN